jgi:FKBP-type peptidyl-prolyl cis-trans isomerase FkpA
VQFLDGFSVNKAILYIFSMALFVCPAVAKPENQRGLDYFNQINQPEMETDSGLKYKIRTMGKGRYPTAKNSVTAHYRGMLLNGAVFDSSYDEDEPIKFSLKRVIKGWTEGIQLMPEGSIFIFLIPPELAYGEKGTRGIPPNSTLIFEVELYDIK